MKEYSALHLNSIFTILILVQIGVYAKITKYSYLVLTYVHAYSQILIGNHKYYLPLILKNVLHVVQTVLL